MKLLKDSYKQDWIFLFETDSKKLIQIKFNPIKDEAIIDFIEKGVTGSMDEINQAENMARSLIRKKREELGE